MKKIIIKKEKDILKFNFKNIDIKNKELKLFSDFKYIKNIINIIYKDCDKINKITFNNNKDREVINNKLEDFFSFLSSDFYLIELNFNSLENLINYISNTTLESEIYLNYLNYLIKELKDNIKEIFHSLSIIKSDYYKFNFYLKYRKEINFIYINNLELNYKFNLLVDKLKEYY